jgi:kinetochore protein Nuf2
MPPGTKRAVASSSSSSSSSPLARSPAWISPRDDDDDGQLGFSDLAGLDNPEHHLEAIRVLRLHTKSRAFLDSIQFKDFTLADLLRPTPRRVLEVLSALINFLFYREEKLNLLQPIVNDIPDYHQRTLDLKARIAEVFPVQSFCSFSVRANAYMLEILKIVSLFAVPDSSRAASEGDCGP